MSEDALTMRATAVSERGCSTMKAMVRVITWLVVGVLVLTTSPRAGAAVTVRQAPSDTSAHYVDVTVEVINNNLLDMRVYAVSHGRSHRLGTVTSFSRQRFRLPRTLVAPSDEVRFVAQPIGSRSGHTTPAVSFTPGDVLEFRIEASMTMSTVRVVTSPSGRYRLGGVDARGRSGQSQLEREMARAREEPERCWRPVPEHDTFRMIDRFIPRAS